MVKLIKLKVRGSSILEPMVAVVIISGIVVIASLIFGNITKKNNNYLLFNAQNQIDLLMQNVDIEEAESFSFETFQIEKEIENYNGVEGIVKITWSVKTKLSDNPIMKQKYLIRK